MLLSYAMWKSVFAGTVCICGNLAGRSEPVRVCSSLRGGRESGKLGKVHAAGVGFAGGERHMPLPNAIETNDHVSAINNAARHIP